MRYRQCSNTNGERLPDALVACAKMGVLVIVNADDLGYSQQRNAGILRCSRAGDGIVTACSLMANGASADEAVQLFKGANTGVSLGLHVNLTEGRPLSEPERVKSLLDGGLFLGKMGFREALAAGSVSLNEVRMKMMRWPNGRHDHCSIMRWPNGCYDHCTVE